MPTLTSAMARGPAPLPVRAHGITAGVLIAIIGEGWVFALNGLTYLSMLAALVVISVGLIMGFRPEAGVIGVILAVALLLVFAFALSWPWIIVGMLVKTPESVMTSSFLLLFPLTFISNIFVDPATMPGWLQAVVGRNPVTKLARASRSLMHGEPADPFVQPG